MKCDLLYCVGFNDLVIYNNANANTCSWSNLGYSYTLPTGLTHGGNARTYIFGTDHFTPNDVEVFCEM